MENTILISLSFHQECFSQEHKFRSAVRPEGDQRYYIDYVDAGTSVEAQSSSDGVSDGDVGISSEVGRERASVAEFDGPRVCRMLALYPSV